MNKNSKSVEAKLQQKMEDRDNKSSRVLEKVHSSRQITMQKRLNRVKTSPGPGDYNLTTFLNSKKGITIPHYTRQSQLKQTKPDPWSYIPNTSFVQPRSPNTTIGREKKFQGFINAPGPADYRINYKAILKRPKMPVIGTSRKLKEIQQKPGPSDYNTLQADKVLKRKIEISIGHEERERRSNSNSPAPNQYKIQDQFSRRTKNKFGFTMGSRIRIRTESDAPTDFLKYKADKEAVMPRAPAFTMKKEKKNSSQLNISPGPAAYSPKHMDRHQTHGITIPNSERKTYDLSQGVGVGKYKVHIENSTPGYSIPRANKSHFSFPTIPGPGDYSPELPKTEKFKSIGIGYGDKFTFIGKEAPGPGMYHISVKEYRQGYTIGHSERPSVGDRQSRPGPADYHTDFKIASKFLSSKKKK